ncbi:Uncharacterised protein [Legionella steigerwaltii]|uniref:Uncharacterized protein n=1 Tax=Legionella steigerwaltii TaxID=460 RepID=A0A378LB33_9GAMM|nr:hypothetical protein [Legionella steigerwaltii]KTD77778.1 hypothetical protein Lstg_2135 [Legionella steigerwaltii]STY23088.1 Uncharacterised protein [Legionella steigerwaltii]
MGNRALPQDIRQNEINYICTVLNHNRIKTTQDLIDNFDNLIEQIRKNPEIFKETYTSEQCFQILKKAITDYSGVYAYKITIKDELMPKLIAARKKKSPDATIHRTADEKSPDESTIHLTEDEKGPDELTTPTEDDLTKVTKGYDRFKVALEKEKTINKGILRVLKDKEFAVVPQIIIGSGDTGTTLWLEKFKSHHGTSQAKLAEGQLPPVLMIGADAGSWKHNYTLAQPHSLLEQESAKQNPSAYIITDHYQKNTHANGRHVYQSNQVNLGLTEAPLLCASVIKIEKRSNHMGDWKAPEQEYRLVVKTAQGIKYVYTDEINICTGLGPARNVISGSLLSPQQFESLNRFNPIQGFTPIVDGNQFILTGMEERTKAPRSIVVYGGGGTAAASYRKGFFGHDAFTEDLQFNKTNQKNSVIWVAKQFDKAGTGRLASTALGIAKSRSELMQGELTKINPLPNGKLLLTFKTTASGKSTCDIELECDQLIYSIGQDDSLMRSICKEAETDLSITYDKNDMLLNVCSSDKKVMFFGAAAMAVREKEYMKETFKWLHSENIGGDVGPGTMAPSRAQIKCYNFWRGIMPTSVNANMDSHHLIARFLEKAGVESSEIKAFVDDLLEARKSSTCGAPHSLILELVKKHKLDNVLEIKGHVHLALKKRDEPTPPKPKQQQLLSWLGSERTTTDATVFVSSVEGEKIPKMAMEKEEHGVQLIVSTM